MASKLGAESSLLVSPAKTKLGCCPLLLELLELVLAVLPEEELGRRSIQGTATCLPEALEPELLLELVELDEPELPEELSEITAKSIRPDAGLIIVSLIVPNWLPEVLLICAPVSWLARNSW